MTAVINEEMSNDNGVLEAYKIIKKDLFTKNLFY
tara:strand:- start:1171 stop:1272 length:102 start_codon:yes stop_codon:yes gene_type:complete